MKKLILLILLFASACGPFIPTPNDFPTPPWTPIVEFPDYAVTPTFEPLPWPITGKDRADASNFLMRIKTELMAGDDAGISEKVHYPIRVTLNGKKTTFTNQNELAANLHIMLTDKIRNALLATDENNLVISSQGIRIGNGEMWFNLFCMDAACTKKEFLITQINN